ncbi:hypothetical protein [Legionella hackeliae]|uniref:DUF1440 domain-containing protein n=1 Tax=Legionella hackeliae TaxID=449 RepID=A0A0A8USQ5_LEGHA|nr:hypothetical protein [Legionella hackeliae]KTD13835.1 hypothetical protein Lhac_0679 [Legionella hackeliae]CEK10536.1 conserved membrane protein of unknown function [Legionella hackeliae]STX47274.1 Uncharacterised protein [Legionella hackeliae]
MCKSRCIIHGVIAGIIAGIVFAIFLFMGGMFETLGAMINMPTKLGGLVVHAGVSIIAGIAFAIILGWLIHSWTAAIIWGLLFGFGMWLAGPMTLLPYFVANTPLFSKWTLVDVKANIPPLVGHLIYGFVLGVVFYALKRKA